MKEIITRLGKIKRSVARRLEAIDNALKPQARLSVNEFIERAKVDSAVKVTVMPFTHVDSIDVPYLPVPGGSSIPTRYDFVTIYKSYSDNGKELKYCDELHLIKTPHEVRDYERRKQYEVQNILTADRRLFELQQLLPGVTVEIVIPGQGGQLKEREKNKVLGEAMTSGFEVFKTSPLR